MESRNVVAATIFTAVLGVAAALATGLFAYQAGLRSVEKDYVVIAANILSNPKSDDSLRQWAIDVMDTLAPVRFSEAARKSLSKPGAFGMLGVQPPKLALEPCKAPKLTRDDNKGGLTAQEVEIAFINDASALAHCEAKRRALADSWPR